MLMDGLERWRLLRLHVEDQVPLAAIARDAGIGLRTLERWHLRYKRDGVAGLDDSPRSDRGRRSMPAALTVFIEHLALVRPRPTVATLHRLASAEAGRLGVAPPSYSTVRDVVAALDPAMVTLAIDGPASYRDRYELVFRRRADRPNATWQGRCRALVARACATGCFRTR